MTSFFNSERLKLVKNKLYRFELNPEFEKECLYIDGGMQIRYIYTCEGFHMEVFFDKKETILKNFILDPVHFVPIRGPLNKPITKLPKAISIKFNLDRLSEYQVSLE